LRRQVEWPRGIVAISISYAAFLLVSIISLLVAVDLAAALKEIAKWLQIGLVAVMIALPGRDYSGDKVVKWIAAALIVSALVQSAVGIWQFGIRGDGPEHFSILGQYFRAYGTFEQPNPYAGFLGLVLPLIIGLGIGTVASWTSRKHHISIIFLVVLVIAALVVSCAVRMSWSRGAWLGLAVAFTVMLLFLPRKKVVGLVILSLVILMGIIAINSGLMPASIEQRMLGFTEYFQFEDVRGAHITPDRFAVLERMAHWQAALSMANESPWIGVGTGNYAAAYPDHALMQWPYALGHAHNLYLNLLAETGVLGLISYLGFWAVALVLIMRLISTSEGVPRGIALGLLGAVTHLSVHNLVDKLYVNNVYLHIGSLIGILVVLISSSRSNVAHN
ncbi:MAG: O-antigen ligase family protein, partial [Chloroflexota bacterium]